MGKWFPLLYDSVMAPLEHGRFKEIRQRLIHDAKGTVLEIGSGTGVNFSHYDRVGRVIAIEPDPLMIGQSSARTRSARASIWSGLAPRRCPSLITRSIPWWPHWSSAPSRIPAKRWRKCGGC